MRVHTFVLASLLGLALLAPAADAADLPRSCTSLTGTWIGASNPNFPFIWVFTPASENRYTSVTELAYDSRPLGYTFWTDWIGEAARTGPTSWESWGVSFWIWEPTAAAEAGVSHQYPELEVVRSRIQMIDCDTFTSTIDLWASYFGWTGDRVPFVDPYDVSMLSPGETIVETYRRLPQPTQVGVREPGDTPIPGPDFPSPAPHSVKMRSRRR